MKTITRTVLQRSVIAGAAFALSALATLPIAHRALAQDTPAPEASADAESPDALPINVQGSWSGTITDDNMGAGTITLSIKQTNRDLTKGSGWTATFNTSATSPQYVGGMENGSRATSKGITLKLGSSSFNKKDCHIQFSSTSPSGTQIQGNYKWAGCGKQFKSDGGGTINVTRTPTS